MCVLFTLNSWWPGCHWWPLTHWSILLISLSWDLWMLVRAVWLRFILPNIHLKTYHMIFLKDFLKMNKRRWSLFCHVTCDVTSSLLTFAIFVVVLQVAGKHFQISSLKTTKRCHPRVQGSVEWTQMLSSCILHVVRALFCDIFGKIFCTYVLLRTLRTTDMYKT